MLAGTASAVPIGHLDVANCSGGGVRVNSTTIDWLPAGGGSGCIQTGTGTNISYSGGTLLPGVQGSILDLFVGNPLPISGFMTFSGTPLNFTLNTLGPGPANLACATVLDPNLPSCSVFLNSPFILAPTATGTSVTLSATGTVTDGAGSSVWIGAFTTQIAGQTPAQIQARIINGETIESTESGDFTLTAQPTAVPEPASLTLLGTGLVGIAVRARRKFRG